MGLDLLVVREEAMSKSLRPLIHDAAQHALAKATRHKDDAVMLGFSEEAAEAMAVTVHSVYMASIFEPPPEQEPLDDPPPPVG